MLHQQYTRTVSSNSALEIGFIIVFLPLSSLSHNLNFNLQHTLVATHAKAHNVSI